MPVAGASSNPNPNPNPNPSPSPNPNPNPNLNPNPNPNPSPNPNQVAARHADAAFEERAPQSYQATEPSDAIDVAFANALHAAGLPLRVACARVSKGMYKLATLERGSYGERGARGRGRPRRVQLVLNPNGLAHVRVGAGTQGLPEFLLHLCAEAPSADLADAIEELPPAALTLTLTPQP